MTEHDASAGVPHDEGGDEVAGVDEADVPDEADELDEAVHDELPADVIDEAERLRRLERNAIDEGEQAAYADRREMMLAEYEFTDRVRLDDGDEVLVLHPEEWHDPDEGVIRTDRIEDLSRAVEIPLEGAGDPDDWDTVDEQNRTLAAAVREEHGGVHGDTADALADFMGNHYAKPITSASGDELEEFRTEYFVRNAWPSAEQRACLDDSLERIYETAEKPVPEFRSEPSQ
ncbi:rnhA operon protein [Natrialbaceae archaeon A-CW3]